MNFCPVQSDLNRYMRDQDAAEQRYDDAAAGIDRDSVRADILAGIVTDPDSFHDFTLDHRYALELAAYAAITAASIAVKPEELERLKRLSNQVVSDWIDDQMESAFEAAVQRELRAMA